eukprot:9278720-Alexandrium_andersonii.AAC.1
MCIRDRVFPSEGNAISEGFFLAGWGAWPGFSSAWGVGSWGSGEDRACPAADTIALGHPTSGN